MSNKKILLIGNGPSALGKKRGERIDSDEFDKVVRFNRWNFNINGKKHKKDFSEYIGSRCDYWVINDNLFTKWAIQDKDKNKYHKMAQFYEKVLVFYPKFKFNIDLAHTIDNSTQYTNTSCIWPHDAEDIINQIVDFKPKWPTTGIAAISWALCRFEEVYICGFDSYDLKYESKRYFEDVENKLTEGSIDHTSLLEKQYIKSGLKYLNRLKRLI